MTRGAKRAAAADPGAFIRRNLRLAPVPGLPEIQLYRAHPGSGLGRLGGAPYWAYPWGGGLALAHFLAERPETVAGKRILDFGAGSGLVAIAAAKAGAASVTATDTDAFARAATGLNAGANDVSVTVLDTLERLPPVDVVLAGDVFYDAAVALRSLAFLDRCLVEGIPVLVGDPGREHLPYERLQQLAAYAVVDFGEPLDGHASRGYVYVLDGQPLQAGA